MTLYVYVNDEGHPEGSPQTWKNAPARWVVFDDSVKPDGVNIYEQKYIESENVVRLVKKESNDYVLQHIRSNRDYLLTQSDWTQLPDNNLSQEKRQQFQRYRQALRDLPQKYANITNIEQVEMPTLEQF